ncbi:MAG: acyltransferase family protein [Cyanothece sp. SIO2G6]|nr:acyltransferase family protein [Cyanothece sp. SIO2G6]
MQTDYRPSPSSADAIAPTLRSNLGWSLSDRNPDVIRSMLPSMEWVYQYYFRVTTDGWEYVPDHPVLFVGSHNGGLASPDMHMFMVDWFRRFGPERLAYGLMHPNAWTVYPRLARLAAQLGAVQAHPKMAIAAFQQDASVLVYPGGAQDVFRPHSLRHKIVFHGRKGFIKLALRENVPIVPLVSTGAHDTLYVIADFYEQARQLHDWGLLPWILDVDPEVFPLYLGWPWGIALGPLPNIPWPRPIHTRVCPPIEFERYGRAAAKDSAYVDQCYSQVQDQMQRSLDNLVAERL